jgi:hypothetical protein
MSQHGMSNRLCFLMSAMVLPLNIVFSSVNTVYKGKTTEKAAFRRGTHEQSKDSPRKKRKM